MLSNTCKYAIRAVLYIALHTQKKQKIGIKKISEDLDIPTPFLGKILQTLAKNKLLSSAKGPNGGFGLGKNPIDISLMDIVLIIDGSDTFNKCIISVKYCSEQENPCALHLRYSHLREEMKKNFEEETLEELINEIKNGKNRVIL